jgi:holin-like protein
MRSHLIMEDGMQSVFQTVTADQANVSPDRRRKAPIVFMKGAVIALQLIGLCALNRLGFWIVARTGVPIPGNLVGMVALYALLSLGIVKLAWVEEAGSILIRHLAFFFVPITIGLMDMGPLFATNFIGIAVTLTASAAIGLLLAGRIAQFLLARRVREAGGES